MSTIEDKLKEIGEELPEAPTPGGSYVPFRRHGDTLYLAGVVSVRNGTMTHTGKVGENQSVESGHEAAKVCALNAMASMKLALGSLDAVESILYVGGYVNAVAGFAQSPQVINGASELFGTVFGGAGKHARAAVAVAGLPMDATVEIQVIVAVKPGS